MSGRRKVADSGTRSPINGHDKVVGDRQQTSPNNYFSSLLGFRIPAVSVGLADRAHRPILPVESFLGQCSESLSEVRKPRVPCGALR